MNSLSPLFSIIVLEYNNQEYIYDALDSIFTQDYPNIQLIVSDDCSINYDGNKLNQYISEHKSKNITNVIINHNEKNLGTVKHLEVMREQCYGDYIMSIAADDALYSDNAISSLMSVFKDNKLEVVTSQVGMYDERLDVMKGTFTSKSDAAIINSGNSQILFSELCSRCFIAASGTVYKKDVFTKLGILSDKYFIIEDWTTHLRLARNNVTIKFIDKITVKHRDGGVSHGNSRSSKYVYRKYCEDYVSAFNNEILPYKNEIPTEYMGKILEIYSYHVKHLKYLKCEEILESMHLNKKLIKKIYNIFHYIKLICEKIGIYNKIKKSLTLSILFYLIAFLYRDITNNAVFYYMLKICLCISFIFAALAIMQTIIYIMLNIYYFVRFRQIK